MNLFFTNSFIIFLKSMPHFCLNSRYRNFLLDISHTHTHTHTNSFWISPGFPGVSDGKQPAYNVGDPGFDPCIRKSPGEGNDNPLQYSCLENSLGRGAWHAAIMKWPRVGHNLGTKAHTSHMWNQNVILKIAFLESISFWDCIQVLHFRLFCWPYHFF